MSVYAMESFYPFIKSYNFAEAISKHYESFISEKKVNSYIQKNTESNFARFVGEYWYNNITSADKLKIKYAIPDYISYVDIIKSYQQENYIRFLKDLYDPEIVLEIIIKKYLLNTIEITSLTLPVEIPELDNFCPFCLEGNKFLIKRVLTLDSTLEYKMFCKNCGIEATQLLSEFEVENEIEINGYRYENFINELKYVENELLHLKCPNCNRTLNLKTHTHRLGYEINCSSCNTRWGSISKIMAELPIHK